MSGLKPTIDARIHELAREPGASFTSIRRRLISEGYEGAHMQMASPSMRLMIRRLCQSSRARRATEASEA